VQAGQRRVDRIAGRIGPGVEQNHVLADARRVEIAARRADRHEVGFDLLGVRRLGPGDAKGHQRTGAQHDDDHHESEQVSKGAHGSPAFDPEESDRPGPESS
jgi:hypothetical protein